MTAEVAEFGEDGADKKAAEANKDVTDEEKGSTHGYEGPFKVGDVVRVSKKIKIWSVKQYAKEGFFCEGFEGVVSSLVLYGRKYKVRCFATCAYLSTAPRT
jgi:hypothetical protein